MMENRSMRPPVIDLSKLQKEILSRGPEAALPCNLSDYWLNQVSESLDQVLEVHDEDSGMYMTAPLALVICLLLGKPGSNTREIGEDELFERFNDYRLELALEEVSRRSDIQTPPASLTTIFTNRSIELAKTEN